MREQVYVAEGFTPSESNGKIKLTPELEVSFDELKDWQNSPSAAGVAASLAVTLGGTYSTGDKIVITLTSNSDSKSVFNKQYVHYVQPLANGNDDLAKVFAEKISLSSNENPFSATAAGPVVTITHDNSDVDFTFAVYTDSVAGTIAGVYTPQTLSIGNPEDLLADGLRDEQFDEDTHDLVQLTWCPEVDQFHTDLSSLATIYLKVYLSAGEGAGVITLLDGLVP